MSGDRAPELAALLRRRLAEDEFSVPPFPQVAQQVLSLASDDSTSSETMARLVHRDAGLASSVLRHANSSVFGAATPIVSLRQALGRLGMQRVAEIALVTSMRSGPFASKRYAPIGDRIWRRSLATAMFAREVAREVRKNVEIAFLCGLLRRVGQPLVLQALSQVDASETPDALEAEAVVLDLDRDFTIRAVRDWRLPPVVVSAIATRTGERADESDIAHLGESLADLALQGCGDATTLSGGGAVERLNLYPESVEALYAHAETILRDVDETP